MTDEQLLQQELYEEAMALSHKLDDAAQQYPENMDIAAAAAAMDGVRAALVEPFEEQ